MTYERKSRRLGEPAAPSESTNPADKCQSNALLRQLRGRREAARRLPRLNCGCGPDPWLCRCHEDAEPTARQVDAYRDAVEHLLAHNLLPAPDADAMRVMWRRGGAEQRLAVFLAERWELAG